MTYVKARVKGLTSAEQQHRIKAPHVMHILAVACTFAAVLSLETTGRAIRRCVEFRPGCVKADDMMHPYAQLHQWMLTK